MNILRYGAFFLASVVCTVASGQVGEYPNRAIKVVVPFGPGSATDSVARIVADPMSQDLRQPVVIESKPGAGGTVGAGMVAAAPPDGYTLLVHSAGHVANAFLYSNLPYDTLRDFACITTLAHLPNVIVVNPAKGFTDLQSLVARARANPGRLNYATAGLGSATHMNTEIFRAAAGFEAQHVPFKGTPDALNEVIAERVDFFFSPLGPALPFVQQGRLKALAVASPQRSPLLPNVPTTAEAGFSGSEYVFWIALLAPHATPQPIVNRLNASAVRALGQPDVKDKLAKLGAETMPMSPADCDRFIRAESARAGEIVKKAGIKAQ